MSTQYIEEIEKFQQWAEHLPDADKDFGWEAGYEHWPALRAAVLNMIKSTDPAGLSPDAPEFSLVLYAVARDNVEQILAGDLVDHPKWLHALASAALNFPDVDARWQLAVALGGSSNKAEAEKLLLEYHAGPDEYVGRMALLALANLGSKQTDQLAAKAWNTKDEYQRIAALWAVKRVNSPHLPKFIDAAKKDGREKLMSNLAKIA
jgi:hypothetical protein